MDPPARPPLPRRFATLDPERLRHVHGLFTDIDDTLTTDGALTPDARQALQSLRATGVPVFAVTGRSVGWSEPFARDWPVDAIVAENGAVALIRDGAQVHLEFAQDAATRHRDAGRRAAVAADIERTVPAARWARDSAGRLTDLAVDHGEFARLDAAQVDAVVAVMRRHGMQATISSIHVNGWFGDHDKLSGARWILQRCLARGLDDEVDRWVFVGDSTND